MSEFLHSFAGETGVAIEVGAVAEEAGVWTLCRGAMAAVCCWPLGHYFVHPSPD